MNNIYFKFWIVLVSIEIISCTSTTYRRQLSGDDIILRSMEEGLHSFYESDYLDSFSKFSFVSEEINKVWADQESAKKASSLWYSEKYKRFKGEPYERMMVDYYLGLLYLMRHDYGNSQAAFKQALLNGAVSDSVGVDFLLLLLLEGISLHYLGNSTLAIKSWEEFRKYQRLPFPKVPNVIFLFETGYGPYKKSDKNNTTLTYESLDQAQDVKVKLELGRKDVSLNTSSKNNLRNSIIDVSDNLNGYRDTFKTDILQLALARGIRQADKINMSKRNFRDGSAVAGDVFIESSKFAKDSEDALLLFALGVLSYSVSSNVVVETDTRYWKNLPANIHAAFWKLETGSYNIKIILSESTENKIYITKYEKKFVLEDSSKPIVIWASSLKR